MRRLLRLVLLVALCVGTTVRAGAQETPSSPEMSGFEHIDGTRLEPATLSYDATVKTGGRSLDLSSTQTIAETTTEGGDTWTLVNTIETPRGPSTDSLVVDRSSLLPVSRHRSGGAMVDLTYTSASGTTDVSGTVKTGGQTVRVSTRLKGPTLAGGVHDVIALSAMPLEPGFSTTLRVFSPQDQATKRAEFEVTGTETVDTPAGSFETYVVDLNVGDGYVTGTVHLRKTAPHYYVKWKTEVAAARGPRTIMQTLTSMEMDASPNAQ
jgi:hypothetical protein